MALVSCVGQNWSRFYIVEVGRIVRRLRSSLGLWALGGFLAVGCGLSTQHGYVQSDDGSLSFRHPGEWTNVPQESVGTEWITGIDASAEPSDANLRELTGPDPVVIASVYQLDQQSRDTTNLSALRRLALPDGRDPTLIDDGSVEMVFNRAFLDDNGFEGHHLRFEIELEDGEVSTAESLIVFDSDRTSVQQLRVVCSSTCFADNNEVIEELFDSVRLKP